MCTEQRSSGSLDCTRTKYPLVFPYYRESFELPGETASRPCLGRSCPPCIDGESALPGDVQEEMPEEDVADVLGRESHSAWQLGLVLAGALVLNENGPQ